MSSNLCRLCCSSSFNFLHSLKDEDLIFFIRFVPHLDFEDDRFTNEICQYCYDKVKICLNFIEKINESHRKLKLTSNKRNIDDMLLKSTDEIVQKIEGYSGISIKKIKKSIDKVEKDVIICSDDESEHLLEEVEIVQPESLDSDDDEDHDSDEDFIPYKAGKTKASPGANKNIATSAIINSPIHFSCGFCKEYFTSFDILSTHMKKKTCFTEKIECKECGKECKTKRHLYSHNQIHKKKAKVMCEACAKEFNSQFDLDTHIESTHRRVVKKDCIFRCTSCNEKFESHLDLIEHVRTHNQEKKDAPRLCEICARMLPNQKSYQAHLSNHRAKSFICEVCKKGFSRSFQLKQHSHLHTGIKAFSCDICQRRYAKRESLRVHKKKEHLQ